MSAGSTMKDTGWIVKCARDNWKSDWPRAREPTRGFQKQSTAEAMLDRAAELMRQEEADGRF